MCVFAILRVVSSFVAEQGQTYLFDPPQEILHLIRAGGKRKKTSPSMVGLAPGEANLPMVGLTPRGEKSPHMKKKSWQIVISSG